MKDFSGLLLKVFKNQQGKEKYILYLLIEKWHDIVGEAAAKHTQPAKLDEHILLVHTDNAAWSHNLLMLKKQVLGKIKTNAKGNSVLKFVINQNTTVLNPKSWITPK